MLVEVEEGGGWLAGGRYGYVQFPEHVYAFDGVAEYSSAMSCGVVTITAQLLPHTQLHISRPGGAYPQPINPSARPLRSQARSNRLPTVTAARLSSPSAPLHATGAPSPPCGRRNPMLMHFTPWFVSGEKLVLRV
ncbi:hypothetical protein L211DRAFT_842877 [Terfezia boudieri ATCC MYA-4762]|uniref:Uncharacterized protein n=1 Tax=Terfezia boudieri ATCC MYA-4762 TaxID=1051890 RepID=A0A3N4LMJ1_9PEZI|nr:hypothetical protein L211DRAFT_842877 [Terfezia boudieri ATCC MYA-4762]